MDLASEFKKLLNSEEFLKRWEEEILEHTDFEMVEEEDEEGDGTGVYEKQWAGSI